MANRYILCVDDNGMIKELPTSEAAIINTVIGGSNSGDSLTLVSTSNATKGKIIFGIAGNSAYDDINTRFGIGTGTPAATIHALATTEQLRLGYDTTNYASFLVASNGGVTLSTTGGNIVISPSATTVLLGGFLTSASNTASNVWCPSGNGVGSTSATTYVFAGASSVNLRLGIRGSAGGTATSGANYASFIIGTETFNIGTALSTLFAQQVIKPLNINTGSGGLTNSASLYIEGAATGATNNYSLWAAGGLTRLDGNLFLGNVGSAPSTPAGGGILFVQGGALKFIGSSGTITTIANP